MAFGTQMSFASAGTHAINGTQATATMQRAAAELDIDMSGHSARALRDCSQPDLVFGMEQHHLLAASAQFPSLEAKQIRLLDHPNAISDPYGLDLASYRQTAARILRALGQIRPS